MRDFVSYMSVLPQQWQNWLLSAFSSSNQLNAPPPNVAVMKNKIKKKHILSFTILFSGCCIDMARPFARSLNTTVKIHLHETGTFQKRTT